MKESNRSVKYPRSSTINITVTPSKLQADKTNFKLDM